jgi:hypothetical protein
LRSNPALFVALPLATLSVAGCGGLNRSATLGLTTKTIRVSGSSAEVILQDQLAREGFATAKVTCARTIVVDVGVSLTCRLNGAGSSRTVRFAFKDTHGLIDRSPLRVS